MDSKKALLGLIFNYVFGATGLALCIWLIKDSANKPRFEQVKILIYLITGLFALELIDAIFDTCEMTLPTFSPLLYAQFTLLQEITQSTV